jgi:hypothetical protein
MHTGTHLNLQGGSCGWVHATQKQAFSEILGNIPLPAAPSLKETMLLMERAKGLPAAHRGSASLRIWTLDRLAASNQLRRQREVQQKLEPGDCVPTISASSLSCGSSMRNCISNCIVRSTSVSTATMSTC